MDWCLDLWQLRILAEEFGGRAKSLRHGSTLFKLYGLENCIDWVASMLAAFKDFVWISTVQKESWGSSYSGNWFMKKALFRGEYYVLLISASCPALFISWCFFRRNSSHAFVLSFFFPTWKKILSFMCSTEFLSSFKVMLQATTLQNKYELTFEL